MEYIIALLVVTLIVILYFKQPNRVYDAIVNSVVTTLQTREGEIVYGLYNKLPEHIKSKVDSKAIAEIVGFTIGILIDIIGKKK